MKRIKRIALCILLLAACLAAFTVPAAGAAENHTIRSWTLTQGQKFSIEKPLFEGKTEDYPGKITWEFSTKGSSKELPPGIKIITSEADGKFRISVGGTPTKSGRWNDFIIFSAGSKVIGSCALTFIIQGDLKCEIWTDQDKNATNYAEGDMAHLVASVDQFTGSGSYYYEWHIINGKKDAAVYQGEKAFTLDIPSSEETLTYKNDGIKVYFLAKDLKTGFDNNGKLYKSNTVTIHVACEHTFGDWAEKTAATCTKDQVMARTCSKCGKEETKKGSVKALGHTLGEWTVDSDALTITRKCKSYAVCAYAETYSFEEFKAKYPEEAAKLIPEEPKKDDDPQKTDDPNKTDEPPKTDEPISADPKNPDNANEPANPDNSSEPKNPDVNPDNSSEPKNPDGPDDGQKDSKNNGTVIAAAAAAVVVIAAAAILIIKGKKKN